MPDSRMTGGDQERETKKRNRKILIFYITEEVTKRLLNVFVNDEKNTCGAWKDIPVQLNNMLLKGYAEVLYLFLACEITGFVFLKDGGLLHSETACFKKGAFTGVFAYANQKK